MRKIIAIIFLFCILQTILIFASFYQVKKNGEKMLDCKEENSLALECLCEYSPLYPNCEEELNKNELGLF